MKFIKILTILSLLLTACTAANYANAFEKGWYPRGRSFIALAKMASESKKDLLVKVISVQKRGQLPQKRSSPC